MGPGHDYEFDNAAEWMSQYTRSLARSGTNLNERSLLTENELEVGGVPSNYKYNDYMRNPNGQVASFGQIKRKPRRNRYPVMPINNEEAQAGMGGHRSASAMNRMDANTETTTITGTSVAGEFENVEGFVRRDNDGDKMERAGLPSNGYYQLPVRPIDDEAKRQEERFFGDRNKNISHIADKTNTHISRPSENGALVLEIWGEKDNVEFAKQLLRYLQTHVDADIQACAKKSSPWAKVKAAPTIRKRDHNRAMEETSRRNANFRRPANEDRYYKGLGAFSWPWKEIAPSVLGMNYEALDPIRHECECYIIWSAKRGAFRIMGDDHKKVERAVDRLFIVLCELAVKNRNPTKIHLVVPPRPDNLHREVALNNHHSLKHRQLSVKRLDANIGVQCAATTEEEDPQKIKAWVKRREVLLKANETYLRKAMAQAVKDLYYMRGHAKMRVYFGTLVLFAYKRPRSSRHNLQEFMDMMRNHQTAGEVIRYIGDKDVGEELISHCDRLTDVFLHVDPQVEGNTPRIEPSYSASFDISLQDEAQHHLYVKLEVDFEKVPETNEYRATTRRWLDIKKNNDGSREDNFMRRKVLLDVKYLDLDHDLAYQFEVIRGSFRRDTDIYPIFNEFVHCLSLDLVPNIHGGDPDDTIRRISYTNLPGMTVESVVQKTKHQYWMSKTSYIFEVTKYDYLPTHKAKEDYSDGIATNFRDVKPDTRYGASLYSCHWDSVLSKQRNLDIGCVGGWTPDMEEFFKNYGVGGYGAETVLNASKFKMINGILVKKEPWEINDEIKQEDEVKEKKKKDGFGKLLDRIDYCVKMVHDVRKRIAIRKGKREEA